MQKNIIILSNLDIWSIDEGKGAPSFFNTLKAYAEDGWDVTLIQPGGKYRKDYKVDNCKIIKFNNNFFDFLNKIPKIRFFAKYFSHIYMTRKFIRESKKLIRNTNKNYIIYSYEVFSVKAGKIISSTYNFPFITRFQGTILTNKKYNLFNRIIRFPHFQALKQKSNLIIMTDDGTKGDKVLKLIGNKSKLLFLKNGQDEIKKESEIILANKEIRAKYNIDDKTSILLTVSRLKNWKRVDRAILTVEELLKKDSNIKLIIVGDGEEYDNLVNLVSEKKLEKNIIFAGAVKQEDIWKYYSCADIFLSLYDLSNVGNPLMEAMRYGKTIITLDNGDTGKVIKNEYNGILLSLSEIEKVPEKILFLMKDKKTSNKFGDNAKKYADENFWTWNDRMNFELKETKNIKY